MVGVNSTLPWASWASNASSVTPWSRHLAVDEDKPGETDKAVEQETARGPQPGVEQREGVGQHEAGDPERQGSTDMASPRTRFGKISESSTQVTGASVRA